MIPPDYCACSFFRVISVRGDDSNHRRGPLVARSMGTKIHMHNRAHLSKNIDRRKISLYVKCINVERYFSFIVSSISFLRAKQDVIPRDARWKEEVIASIFI